MTQEEKFKLHMSKLDVPEGFSGEFRRDMPECLHTVNYLLKKEGVEIMFDITGSGHTRFKANGEWYTFDRLGVEDSFYHLPMYKGQKVPSLNEIVAEQLARVENRIAYHKTAVKVPGLPGTWTVAHDKVQELKDQLKANGHITFTPAGFGTGYCVTRRRPAGPLKYGRSRAKPELEEFLEFSPLYVENMDCD
jgi:hypothetical protein